MESQFYNDINKDLRENKKDKYLLYIKILYEGIKLKVLPIANDNILYRGSKISNNEINKIKEYINNKKPDLPGAIVFSRSFLSFSKDKSQAEQYLISKNKDNNLSKVLYIIEKDNNMDYSLSTHSDIENISKFPDEKEVLFFPFSSFEIKEIKETNNNNEIIYEINLLYLGKYLKEIENLEDIKIPEDSIFKKEMIKLGLIPKQKLEKTKEVINQYKEYKNNIINNNYYKNEYKENNKANDKDYYQQNEYKEKNIKNEENNNIKDNEKEKNYNENNDLTKEKKEKEKIEEDNRLRKKKRKKIKKKRMKKMKKMIIMTTVLIKKRKKKIKKLIKEMKKKSIRK